MLEIGVGRSGKLELVADFLTNAPPAFSAAFQMMLDAGTQLKAKVSTSGGGGTASSVEIGGSNLKGSVTMAPGDVSVAVGYRADF